MNFKSQDVILCDMPSSMEKEKEYAYAYKYNTKIISGKKKKGPQNW